MSLRYDHLVIGGGSAARDLRRGRTDRIATAIETVLAQPDLMRRLGENARKFAVENYSLPMLAQRKYELLADVARRHPVDSAANVWHTTFSGGARGCVDGISMT